MDSEVRREICGVEIISISGKLCVELNALEKFGICTSEESDKADLQNHLELLGCKDGLHMPGEQNMI